MEKKLAELRENYGIKELLEEKCPENPFELVDSWILEATEKVNADANAMVLTTVGNDGQPSSRMVLLKEVSDQKFVFYTNYKGKKARQMQENKKVALLFWWVELERQLRVEGTVKKLSREKNEIYFHSRPKGSQIGATASPQSTIISREKLVQNYEKIEDQYQNEKQLPLPEQWGGYEVTPHLIEFWQGRPNRLHDRVEYTLEGKQWSKKRLAP